MKEHSIAKKTVGISEKWNGKLTKKIKTFDLKLFLKNNLVGEN